MSKTTWTIDPTHSEVQFKVKHLVISTVTGHFSIYDGKVTTEESDWTTAQILFSVNIDSINTGQEQRDAHLKSADFFDAANYPQMTFESTSIEKVSDDTYKLHGTLSIRDVSKPVTLNVEYGGQTTDFYGNQKAGFEINGKINRKEFGLTWNGVTEAGSIVVSDEVKLIANIQLVKQVEQEA
ncbi:Polyisoprenoid-binding protein YceI [Catalinimonas alkaloidigena]|uniref:Polyisoprenoid-binding protein YceI n=1 Tax=Catalinimonas alkaloidigena TaxID=1075417 RepID=A0A1G9ANS4_9BACT|nr:YceI family protein [Catalinimonas alkaloidigena]SDK28893.1 Polyisoprenoid-binding protein YceI [Catalinimonas alkaloidigena]